MEDEIQKKLYHEFICIGGDCPITCCKGWEVSVDSETYHKWKKEFRKEDQVKHTIWKKKSSGNLEYKINMGQGKCCPYFNEAGLCRIVIRDGEEYLPNICRQFPRVINEYEGRKEYTLSCACPEVVDILRREGEGLQLFVWDDRTVEEELPLFHLRETLLKVLSSSRYSLKDRLLLGLIILSECAKNDMMTKEAVVRYREEYVLDSYLELWREEEVKAADAALEQNELFLDITENYRKEEHYRDFLEPLATYAEEFDVRDLVTRNMEFEKVFSAYDKLIEQCLMIKVFSECICDELEEVLLSFQMIILEYVMLRHSVFLTLLLHGSIKYQDIRNSIVIFSRMIGNNPEGIREFFEESFEEGVWDPWYFLLLLNQ